MASLIDIEGIGPKYAAKLKAVGVRTTEKLLEMGATPAGRKELASKAGISDTLILEWVNLSDLFRLKVLARNIPICLKKPAWILSLNLHCAMLPICIRRWLKSMQRKNLSANYQPRARLRTGSSRPRNCPAKSLIKRIMTLSTSKGCRSSLFFVPRQQIGNTPNCCAII